MGIGEQSVTKYCKRGVYPDSIYFNLWRNCLMYRSTTFSPANTPFPCGHNPPLLQVETVNKFSHMLQNSIGQGMCVPARLLKDAVAAGAPVEVEENHVEDRALIYADRK